MIKNSPFPTFKLFDHFILKTSHFFSPLDGMSQLQVRWVILQTWLLGNANSE